MTKPIDCSVPLFAPALALSALALVAAAVWVGVSASTHNAEHSQLCERNGLVMAKDLRSGEYGCAQIISFKDTEMLDGAQR